MREAGEDVNLIERIDARRKQEMLFVNLESAFIMLGWACKDAAKQLEVIAEAVSR